MVADDHFYLVWTVDDWKTVHTHGKPPQWVVPGHFADMEPSPGKAAGYLYLELAPRRIAGRAVISKSGSSRRVEPLRRLLKREHVAPTDLKVTIRTHDWLQTVNPKRIYSIERRA